MKNTDGFEEANLGAKSFDFDATEREVVVPLHEPTCAEVVSPSLPFPSASLSCFPKACFVSAMTLQTVCLATSDVGGLPSFSSP